MKLLHFSSLLLLFPAGRAYLAGQPCIITFDSEEVGGLHQRRWSETIDCGPNAHCNNEGYCECNSDSYKTPYGHCLPRKKFSEVCESGEECFPNQNLICLEGKCSCNVTEAIYDEERRTCVGKVGASCRKYSYCVKNAHIWRCGRGSYNDLCRCNNDFSKSEDGLCLGSYGASCDPISSPCNDQWTCRNGQCRCHFPDQQIYEGGKCKSQVNGPCRETVRGKVFQYECIGEAECRSDNGHPECLCRKGYIQSTNGECKKSFGSSCKRSEDCDGIADLICEDGVCACRDFQEYNNHINKCVGYWGANCYENNDNYKCGENLYCEISRHDKNAGHCRCDAGTKVNGNRRCIPEIEEDDFFLGSSG